MAFRFSSADDGDLPVNHDINVTPFIDVMLVLLIIFMVAAPLATADVKVDLPVARAEAAPRPDKPVTLTVRANGSLALDEKDVAEPALGASIRALTIGTRIEDQRIYLRADRTVPYERIMTVMNDLRAAGYVKVALVGLESPQ